MLFWLHTYFKISQRKIYPVYSGTIIIIFLLLFPCTLSGQKQIIKFQHLTSENGLPQNMVDCILKDNRGFMWFGTWNGLCRFDGYDFTVFKQNSKDKNVLSDNFIHDLCQDDYGNIWIGTNRGLNVFVYDEEKFITYFHSHEKESILSDRINSVIKDEKGRLWIGTNAGIDILTIKENGIVSGIEHFNGKLSGNDIQTLYHDSENIIWAGTQNGLTGFDPETKKSKIFRNVPFNPLSLSENTVNAIYKDKSGILWVGTNFGLNRMDSSGNFTRYFYNPLNPLSLAHNSVRSIKEDLNGNLIIGTLGGLSILNKNGTFNNYYHHPNSSYSLNNDFINCIFTDDKGMVWIGTERGGINKFSIHLKYFEYFEYEPGNENSLSHKTVNCIREDEKYIWIGTAGGGLNRFDKKTGTYFHYRYIAGNPNSLPIDFITSLHKDKTGNLWIGTWGGGLHKLTPQNISKEIFNHFRPNPSGESSLINDFVSSIIEDSQGNLWIGTLGGLDRFNPQTGKFDHVTSTFNNKSITQVGCIQIDTENNLWAGTIQGLFKLYADHNGSIDPASCRMDYFKNEPGNRKSLSGDYVISICMTKNGTLWFGTYGNGINKLIQGSEKKSGADFESYSEEDGLSNNVVYGILEDENGFLWLSTDNGLSLFNPENLKFRNFYSGDGLLGNQFYWSSCYKNSGGKLYFGGMDGLNAFYPDKVTGNKPEPSTIITDFKIYNESVMVGKEYFGKVILDKTITNTKKISLSYKAREFGFEFSALDFNQPEKMTYSYKLKGFDNKWIDVDANRRFAVYTNLKGGEYIFQVRSMNEEGTIQTEPSELLIEIIPPFWATLWFKILLTGLVIISIVSYNRYRVFSLKNQKRKLEVLVNERTAKIEEQKEELIIQAGHLKDTNFQLEKKKEEIEGQKMQLERQNVEILAQRDKLIELNKKVQLINQQQLKFFTHISHEFRTPLTLISAPVEQMMEELGNNSIIKRKLQLVHKNTQRLLHLINQLMEVRKVETGKIDLKTSKKDIVFFIKNISQSFSELARLNNIKFDFVSEVETMEILFDDDKIENIVYNLLSNAFKYTEKNGSISIYIFSGKKFTDQADYIPIIDKHSYKNFPVSDFIEIEITDTGIGIEHNHLKDIFRRFYRVDNHKDEIKGTGIGLFLVKELVKAHKGLLYVKSRPGEGSSFKMLLPSGTSHLSEEEIVSEKKDKEKISGNIHVEVISDQMNTEGRLQEEKEFITFENGKPSLLLVDDDSELLRVTSEYLARSFRIHTAENGKTAFEKAIEEQPDLVISDIMMPVTDGIELCNMLKSNISTSHIPLILLTARSEVEDFIEGLESGADDYISKPFNIKILEAKSKSLIENRKKLRKLFSHSLVPVPKEITTNRTDELFLQRTIKIVEENLNNSEFSVQMLASELCMSRSMLHKKLTAIVDLSAIDFITSMRMKKSALLLIEGNFNISEVAFEVGFNDPKYFSRCFKKHFGVSPSGYTEGNKK